MTKPNHLGYQVNLMIDACDGAGVYVRSPDLPGLHLIGKSLASMKGTVEKAIKRLFKDNHGEDVNVIWLAEIGTFKSTSISHLPNKLAVTLKAA